MSQNCSTLEEYSKDKRIPCKYGAKCYQKNPVHHEKYKHPPSKEDIKKKPIAKKMKIETADKKIKEIKISHESSESDNENSNDSSSKVNKETISDTDYSESGSDPKSEDLNDNHESASDKKAEKIPYDFDVKEFIKEKFLVEMPDDFYEFWELCKKIKPANPTDAFKEMGLQLVGAFDVLAGKFNGRTGISPEDFLVHWRYFHDTPEFQTVLRGDAKTGFHIGYWRDTPDEPPVFMVSNKSKEDGIILTMGDNIFAAVNIHLEEVKKNGNPFQRMAVAKYQKPLLQKADELKLSISHKTEKMRSRDKKIVTRTFNKIGLVVPYNRKTQLGYRELTLNNKDLKQVLDAIAKASKDQQSDHLSTLQPCLTYASIALDECDFGTGIELGWNIIAHGVKSLNATAARFLKSSYQLLNREAFAKIAEAHMKNRRESTDLSIL